MTRTAQRALLGSTALVAGLLVFVLGHGGCFPFGGTIEDSKKRFLRESPQGIVAYQIDGHEMSYATAGGDPSLPLVLFVHGSPGSWDAWAEYLLDPRLRRAFQLFAVDRPGFGGSEPGRAVKSLAEQARLIHPILARRPAGSRAIVVGHSLGGPVAVQLALDYPREVGGLLILAGSVSPALEERRWFNHAASWRLTQAILPDAMVVSNDEIYDLRGQLLLQDARWGELDIPVHVIQGMEDDLVPPGNADYVESKVPRERLTVERVPGLDHFVPWRKQEMVVQALLRGSLSQVK